MSSATPRIILSCLFALSLAACGDVGPVNPNQNNGDGQSLCSSTSECPTGQLCTSGLCVENVCTNHEECGNGFECNVLAGLCEPADDNNNTDGNTDENTDGNTDGTISPEGGPCSSPANCEDGLVCKGGKCAQPSADNRCGVSSDCAKGKICNFSGQCEVGCEENQDCDAPETCHPQKFTCETCSLSNPCPAGQACNNDLCEPVQRCESTQDCVNQGLDGMICNDAGKCANCARHNDCRVEIYVEEGRSCGLSGLCEVPLCDGPYCQEQMGPDAYCDDTQTPPACAISSGGCQNDGQCAGDMVCDLGSSSCVGAGACVGAEMTSCQSECQAQGRTCNSATCLCVASGGNGGLGDTCISAADCGPAFNCVGNICSEGADLDMFECMGYADPFEMMLCMAEGGGMGCAQVGGSMFGVLSLMALLGRRRRKKN